MGEQVVKRKMKESKCIEVLMHLLGARQTTSPRSVLACQRARRNQESA